MDTSSDTAFDMPCDGVMEWTPNPSSHNANMRLPMEQYLSETNRYELIACGFKGVDIAKCWAAYFNKRATKGKCQACGLAIRIPPYLNKILGMKYHKDKDKPHAMFVYCKTVEEMEKINPQRAIISKPRYRPEEHEDYDARNPGPSKSCKSAYVVDGAIDLSLQMEVLGGSIDDARSAKCAALLIPICFECYLGAKKVTDEKGYRLTSVCSVPNLDDKLHNKSHLKHDELSMLEQRMINLDQLKQRLAWCTLPGSRHCIHVNDNGKAGFKVCAKRRPPIIQQCLAYGLPTYNDYCCLEHRTTNNDAPIMPPPQYIGMFRHYAMF